MSGLGSASGKERPSAREAPWYVTPYEGSRHKACLCCGSYAEHLPMNARLCVGFGVVRVTRDGETIWSGDDWGVWIRRFERRAAADPDHDWRVRFDAPLGDATYQRHGDKIWTLIEKGQGFA